MDLPGHPLMICTAPLKICADLLQICADLQQIDLLQICERTRVAEAATDHALFGLVVDTPWAAGSRGAVFMIIASREIPDTTDSNTQQNVCMHHRQHNCVVKHMGLGLATRPELVCL